LARLLALTICLGFVCLPQFISAQLSLKQSHIFTQEFNQDYRALGFHTKVDSTPNGSALLSLNKSDLKFALNPAIDIMQTLNFSSNSLEGRYGVGVDIQSNWKRWDARLTYLGSNAQYLNYQKSFIREYGVMPTYGKAKGEVFKSSHYIDAFISFRTKKYFQFELGYGRNFIGDGYRSLLLSDHSQAFPYLKINTKFWKIRYTTLFSMHQNIFQVEGTPSLYQQKYTATHYLQWDIKPWISFGLFETIIWAADDGVYHRGFDVNYLNPVIFYRPVEFSVGSSDNAIVGANLTLVPTKTQKFYFQVLLDEFLLNELKADVRQWRNPDQDIKSHWWANKYGIQIGWQGKQDFGIKGLSHLFEFNLVRPFTYAHTNPTQAYSNFNMPLANPNGANFQESIARLSYSKKKWAFTTQYVNIMKGFSPTGTNLGDNLELSNQSRESDYENHLGQGIQKRIQWVDCNISYLVHEAWKMSLTLGYNYRIEQISNEQGVDEMIYIRLRTNLFNQYWDY